MHPKTGCTACGCSPYKFRILKGQVGQESHRRPAVVEVAALCPRQSYTVPESSGTQRFHCRTVPYRPVAFHRIAAIVAASVSTVAKENSESRMTCLTNLRVC